MKKLIIVTIVIGLLSAVTACYKNRYDITEFTQQSIQNISFRKDVVPIVTAGGCGCHNNGTTRQFAFSKNDTVYYATIIAKAQLMDAMAKGGPHPAEGSVSFTPSQAAIIIAWVAQGAKDDFVPPPVTGSIGYAQQIVPLYKASCTGSSCHGGLGPVLDYNSFKNNEQKLRTMMASLGAEAHSPRINIDQNTATNFIAWMNGGFQQ